jgi:hypothetical protein
MNDIARVVPELYATGISRSGFDPYKLWVPLIVVDMNSQRGNHNLCAI